MNNKLRTTGQFALEIANSTVGSATKPFRWVSDKTHEKWDKAKAEAMSIAVHNCDDCSAEYISVREWTTEDDYCPKHFEAMYEDFIFYHVLTNAERQEAHSWCSEDKHFLGRNISDWVYRERDNWLARNSGPVFDVVTATEQYGHEVGNHMDVFEGFWALMSIMANKPLLGSLELYADSENAGTRVRLEPRQARVHGVKGRNPFIIIIDESAQMASAIQLRAAGMEVTDDDFLLRPVTIDEYNAWAERGNTRLETSLQLLGKKGA